MNDSQSVDKLLAAGKAASPNVSIPGYQVGVVLPPDYQFEPLDPAQPAPLFDFIQQEVELSDTESFIAYVKRYQTKDTVIFATLPQSTDGSGAEFRSVFDYHIGGKGDDHKPARTAHQAFFPCPLSSNWKAWIAISGKPQTQDQFINFIEANSPDIVSPDSATLMEMAVSFEATTEVQFLSKIDRLTGARKLTYNETVTGGVSTKGTITVPDSLRIKLPVFEGGKAFEATARLEWRPHNNKLTVTAHLLRQQDIVRGALKDIRAEIAEAVKMEPMNGHLA